MELRQLKYYIAVAEKLHYGRAAEQLYISQPALSQQIRQLEQQLGVELFDTAARKNFRKVKLTPAGEHLLTEGRKLLLQAAKLESGTRHLGNRKATLRLGVYKALLKERIVEFMEQYRAQHPYTEISISEFDHYVDVQDALRNGEIDQGLTLLPLHHSQLRHKILVKGGLSLIFSKQHPLAHSNFSMPHLLGQEQWIELSPKVHPVYREIEERCEQYGMQRKIVQEVSSLNLLISLVSLNNGIAFAPTLFNFTNEPNIVVRSLEETLFRDIEICHIAVWA